VYLFYALENLQTAYAWHLLIEQHQVEALFLTDIDGIIAVGYCRNLIAFLFEKENLSLQLLYLIVNP
jgi:hypothetical protein